MIRLYGQSQKVLDLTCQNRHCNPGRKTGRNGIWDIFNQRSEPEQSHQNQQNACHDSSNDQAVHSALCHNSCHNRCKGSRRSCNLYPGTSQKRDDETGNNRSVNSLLRCYSRCKCQCNRKRQCNNCHNDPRYHILHQLLL